MVTDFSILRGKDTLIVLGTAVGERPFVVYCGPDLPGTSPEELIALQTSQHIPGGPQQPVAASLLNPLGTGWPGGAGLIGHSGGDGWAIDLRTVSVQQSGTHTEVLCEDHANALRSVHSFTICSLTGVLKVKTQVSRTDEAPFSLKWCAPVCLPLDDRLTRLRSFSGKWAGEFHTDDIARFRGTYLRENKAGRTSHSDFPGLFAGTQTTGENSGLAAAFHLGWSGNSRFRLDTGQDGRAFVQAGELLLPGEFAAQQTYVTPDFFACWSDQGYGDVSRRLHAYVDGSVMEPRPTPRPVHFNTWEAVYFDHSTARLLALAEDAAEAGAERFVLDDGWFGGRRNDAAGLGDWWVSDDIYPGGLHPIADKVRDLGMEFGLWFEPEMVNPDSDLYRTHPDWVLAAAGSDQIPSRNQLTLDLTKPEVCDYLFGKVTALIAEYAIDYIKWDMNRDTQHPGSNGQAAMHRQTLAVYALIDRIRDAYLALEIETCASGGGRADYEILRRTDRIWTSDNNDARGRYAIMRGASHFFPLKILGNHIGPKCCHTTGRTFAMHFRAGSAIFGHMGMELDLADETAEDRAVLAAAIALHKAHRNLIHSGAHYRLETPDFLAAQSCVASHGAAALTGCALLDTYPATIPPRLHFAGLNPQQLYRTRMVWPQHNPSLSSPSIIDAADLASAGFIASGSALMEHGMQLPLTHPDTCLIFHSEALDG